MKRIAEEGRESVIDFSMGQGDRVKSWEEKEKKKKDQIRRKKFDDERLVARGGEEMLRSGGAQ